ncbi:MAG: hypothetical protein PHQ46_05000 [Negativicutes bacterium]|nr:hypothetical protein [Negativicutes bacterium]
MMNFRITLLVIVLSLFTMVCLAAPAVESKIALYPGSFRDDVQGETFEVDTGEVWLMATNCVPLERTSHNVKSYFTNATVEEVTAFYWNELNAAQIDEDLQHPATMALGGTSKVDGQLRSYEPFRDIYQGERKVQSAGWIKNTLAANRKPSAINGQWLRESMFIWNAKAADGKYVVFNIAITDISFDQYYQRYHSRTLINIATNVFVPEDDE